MSCVTDTQSISLLNNSGQLSAALRISADAGNAATVHADGLYVSTSFTSGMIIEYGAAAAPSGWLLCDGAEVSRSTYAALYAVIGTTYGVGNGTSTFNTPDHRGRVSVGYAASGGHTDVSTLGLNDGVATANRRAKHRHTVTDPGHLHGIKVPNDGNNNGAFSAVQTIAQTSATSYSNSYVQSVTTGISVGTGTDSLDAPAYLVVNKIIKT